MATYAASLGMAALEAFPTGFVDACKTFFPTVTLLQIEPFKSLSTSHHVMPLDAKNGTNDLHLKTGPMAEVADKNAVHIGSH